MAGDVVLERFGFELNEDLLTDLGERAVAPKVFDLWDNVLDDFLVAEKRLFATERGWKPIKTSTIRDKAHDRDPRVRANSHRVNVATGALREHMTSKAPNHQPLTVDAEQLRLGIAGGRTDVFYGRFQAAQGRDPLVSRAVIRRIAGKRTREHLLGGTSG